MRALFVIACGASVLAAQPKPEYEVYALQYATIPNFRVASLVDGADRERKLDIAMLVWLLRGSGHNILVDSGFYHEKFFPQWHPSNFVRPSETLSRVGLKPEDITDVVITHLHWDHADGMDLFPNARIWVQRTSWNITPAKPGNRAARTEASIPTTCSPSCS